MASLQATKIETPWYKRQGHDLIRHDVPMARQVDPRPWAR